MANALYPKFKEAALQGQANLDSGSVKVLLVDLQDYTYSGSHQFLSDIPVGARVATSNTLTGKTFTNGTFNSDDPVFATASGDQSEALVLIIDTGSASTSRLIAFYDTGVVGLPVTPNGGDINVVVNPSGWFSL